MFRDTRPQLRRNQFQSSLNTSRVAIRGAWLAMLFAAVEADDLE
jgi:hypothetical protein